MAETDDRDSTSTGDSSPEQALALLKQMTVAQRILAISADVASEDMKFAGIDTFVLAELVGVPSPEQPVDWEFVTSVRIQTLKSYHKAGRICDGDELLAKLAGILDSVRLEEVRADCEAVDSARNPDFSFLSKLEQRELAKVLAHEELQRMIENGGGCVACYGVSEGSVELWFHGEIEDDGSCVFLMGPYDGVEGPLPSQSDGKFVRESWC